MTDRLDRSLHSPVESVLLLVKLEPENNSSLVPEIALVVVATREGIAKTGQQVVNFNWPDGDVFVDRYVDASADDEVKRIVAGRPAGDDTACRTAVLEKIPVEIAVSSPEQRLGKWLEVGHAVFKDRATVVGEQITLRRNDAIRRATAIWARRYGDSARIAAVGLKLAHDAHVLAEVVGDRCTAPIQIERANKVVVLGIGMNKGIINRNFDLRCILREGSASEKQNQRNKK